MARFGKNAALELGCQRPAAAQPCNRWPNLFLLVMSLPLTVHRVRQIAHLTIYFDRLDRKLQRNETSLTSLYKQNPTLNHKRYKYNEPNHKER